MSQSGIVIDAETGEIVEADDAWERHRRIVTLRNEENASIRNVTVSFFVPGLMTRPKVSAIPITSPVALISGPKKGSTSGNMLNGKTASLTAT